MRFSDILVHLDDAPQAEGRLALAAELARQHGAHLVGLFVVDVMPPLVAAGDEGGGAVLAGLMESLRQDALARAATLEAAFRERLRRDGIAGEWRSPEGATAELVALHGRYADLLVLGQEDPSSDRGHAVVETVLFGAGRPVLVVPYAGRFATLGRRVLVGWNAGREATRAVHDALPLLARAEMATVVAVNPRRGLGGHGDEPGADLARHLARHGVTVTAEHIVTPDVPEGEMLLSRAAELEADLLVVGAYGHSRLRELVLGGVTRTLLRTMTLPTLLSH